MLPESFLSKIRAFQESRVLLTAIELDVFNAVGEGTTAAEAARRLQTDPGATERLLNALASLEVLQKSGGVFRNGPEAARYFTRGSADDARMAMMHQVTLWKRWSTLTECVRTGEPQAEPMGGPQ